MASQKEHTFRVLQYAEIEYVILVHVFRRHFGKEAPSDQSIRKWHQQFEETGCATMCFSMCLCDNHTKDTF